VLVDREGVREEGVLSFSFIPVRDGSGRVGGLLIPIIDPTATSLRQELERAHDDVEAYSYSISHDFRAPLRTMEGMTRIVVDDFSPQLPADALRLLHHIMRGAAKLADRADAVLGVTRLSRQPLSRQRIDVAALVDGVIVELRNASPERRIEVVVGDLPAAEGDPELLRLVFANLLSNAFKFTRNTEHARIEVGCRPQQRDNVYYVKDNGAGFDMKYAGKLYGFFQRLHSEAEFEGIGAGLALARRLIERHGGTIRAEAQKDCGATFYLTLPVCRTCGET
jgi:light-regulated signal transduction histidine kinase (bacteriophytochrome)